MIFGAYHVSSVIYVFNTVTPLTLSTMEPQMQLKTGFSPAKKKKGNGRQQKMFVDSHLILVQSPPV